jgi:hypothetical protein
MVVGVPTRGIVAPLAIALSRSSSDKTLLSSYLDSKVLSLEANAGRLFEF